LSYLHNILKRKKNIAWVILAITFSILIYGFCIEPNQVEIRHLWIKDARLNKVLKGKTAVQISDLHIRSIGKHEEKILNLIEALKPDLIFLTGDYVRWEGDYEPALTFLSRLKAKIGVWAIMGDYDYRTSRKCCLFCHEPGKGIPTQRHNVRFLRNSVEQVSLPGGRLMIGGIDEEFENSFYRKTLRFLRKNTQDIILCHNPLVFDLLDNDQNVIMLSGDTHGGQISLPSWIWRILGYEKNARYNQGLFINGKKKMYVTRGIGTSHLPLRIFRPPELVVLHF